MGAIASAKARGSAAETAAILIDWGESETLHISNSTVDCSVAPDGGAPLQSSTTATKKAVRDFRIMAT